MKTDIEKRVFRTEYRVTQKDKDEVPTIEGYSAVFNSDSEDMGFIERIAPGAFKKALKKSDVRSLFNHDPNFVLGRTKSGTLKLTEDETGLRMVTYPPDTQLIQDLVVAPIKRGDIDQQSFAFRVAKDTWEDLDKDIPKRTILEVEELLDVSVVTYPAYADTSVALRSLGEARSAVQGGGEGGRDEDGENIEIEVNGIKYRFGGHDEFDLIVEKINELRANLTIPAWIRSEEPTFPQNETKDDLMDRITKIIKEKQKNEDY